MRDKIIKTQLANYIKAPFTGENLSGLNPVGDNIVVMVDPPASHAGKIGSIVLPEAQVERMGLAATTGCVVALGEDAFVWNADRTRQWVGTRPEVGSRVMFRRYAGEVHEGQDGNMYRLMVDREIGAIMF